MKKITVGFMILLITVLAACGNSESAKDVYLKAVEAGENMESAELDMVLSQTIEGDPMLGTIVMDIDTKASLTLDPLAMHQKGSVLMDMQGVSIETDMEMYVTETELYMYESMSETWMKMDSSMMPLDMLNMEQSPGEQLDMLESFIDDVEFTEEEDYYVYKFDGAGEEFEELSQELIKLQVGEETFADLGADITEVLENMTIHSIFYEIHIDKTTYDTQKVISTMDFDVNMEGEEPLSLQQEMTATYTGINTIDQIEVPQEVIDAAEEM